jgi:proton-coupled amino acid transporter
VEVVVVMMMVLMYGSGYFSLAQSVKVMIAVAIFLTYGLQFYVPMEIIWKSIGHRFGAHKLAAEYAVRTILVIGTGECQ